MWFRQAQEFGSRAALGADADQALERLADTGVGRAALSAVPDDQRVVAMNAVRESLADHTGDDGVLLGGAVLVITASARS